MSFSRLASVLLAFLIQFLPLTATSANAAKFQFGATERLNHLLDVDLKGTDGEALYLGYKTSTQSFLLPYTISDDGYILGIRGQERFYRLEPQRIRELQSRKALPTPLPAYEISLLDRIFGHLLWFVLGGIAAWIGWSSYRDATAKKAEAMVAEANEHAREGRLAQAIDGYSAAIKTAPKLVEAYHNRALAHEQMGDYDKAISDQTTIIRLAPKNAEAFLMRASTNQRKGDHQRAIADFGSVLRIEPAHALAFLGRSVSLREMGDHDGALADLDKLIELAPAAAVGYATRSELLETLGLHERAALDKARASELAQTEAQGHAAPA